MPSQNKVTPCSAYTCKYMTRVCILKPEPGVVLCCCNTRCYSLCCVPELLLLFSISFLFLLLAVLDGAFTIGLILLYNISLEIKLFQSLVYLGTFNTTSKWTGCLRKLESVSFAKQWEIQTELNLRRWGWTAGFGRAEQAGHVLCLETW